MTTDQINYLNVALMLLAAGVALFLPFQLFVAAYTILGPLHYLTEISWLQKRQYFSPGKRDYLWLLLITLIVIFPVSYSYLYNALGPRDAVHHLIISNQALLLYHHSVAVRSMMMFIGFASAVTMILTKDLIKRLIAFVLIIVLAVLFRNGGFVSIFFALFVPTLIHVFVFTGVFMLVGALRGKSFSGYLTIGFFIICAVALFLVSPNLSYHPAWYLIDRYEVNFAMLNSEIFNIFLHKKASQNDIYFSNAGILITRFIAFAYTYHYLNWFSKTSVIKWHQVSKRSAAVILSIWVLSLVLYYASFRLGLIVLYFMATLHVLFEFPLNFQSFKELGKLIGGMFTTPQSDALSG